MKKIAIFLLLVTLTLGNVSCDKYLDVNTNVDAPEWVEPHLRLASICATFRGCYWDTRAIGPLTQFMGTTAYTSYATHGYSAASDSAAEQWRMTYFLLGMNLEDLINDSEDAEMWRLAGIGYAIKAFSWDQTTKACGDMPLHDAFAPGLLSHRYDTQDEVYKYVRSWAYKAIELLTREDKTVYGTRLSANDYFYEGDADKWTKFAYAVLARNYASMSNKNNFLTTYADSVIYCVDRSFASSADDATLKVDNTGVTDTKNYWGPTYNLLANTYFQSDWMVQMLTGTLPVFNNSGDLTSDVRNPQIICDTIKDIPGHYDPRAAVLLSTFDPKPSDYDSVKYFTYTGARITSRNNAPNFFGFDATVTNNNAGVGRWIYRDGAPYILMTYSELQFVKAETMYKQGNTAGAYEAFKNGVAGHMDFVQKYIYVTNDVGGDKIDATTFRKFAEEYLNGPYVNGLGAGNLTLSHIMMQKMVAMFPWSQEGWVDLRKYHYDLVVGGEGIPVSGTSYTPTYVIHKGDNATDRVYKGFYLPSAQVEGRRTLRIPTYNEGAPCYRLRPRYNSEYMWNLQNLAAITPIPGTDEKYQTSVVWFAKPNE